MTKQEKARIRNWNKARMLSFSFNKDGFSDKELSTLHKIYQLRHELLLGWDQESVNMGMNVKPKKEII